MEIQKQNLQILKTFRDRNKVHSRHNGENIVYDRNKPYALITF